MYKDKFICDNISVSENGHLLFAGQDTVELAQKYGTALYLMDEEKIRSNCRTYLTALEKAFGKGKSHALYASKAASFKRMYEIMKEEGMGIDVVSCGEIYTAVKAGFPMENAYFHSNNKTDEDIEYAIKNGVGCFVADNEEEILSIDKIAGSHGIKQKIMIRLTPGIDPHTFAAVTTGKVDSKFGSAIQTGRAEEITAIALGCKNIDLIGFHCHVGSQVFDSDVYIRSAEIMLDFIAFVKEKYGYEAKSLDLGGGYGVRYTKADPVIDITANILSVGEVINKKCGELGINVPVISMEPGRSIVADAGMTLYSVGSLKKIPGFINYVSIDGGMTDNVRYAMYGSAYTLLPANKMNEAPELVCSVVGRCCESGDIIQPGVELPASVKRGDIIATLTTGAYNYSMASNYNRVPRLPIVMLYEGKNYVAVKRETFEDVARLDV